MPIREAIILAGGLGTRLRSALPGLPKCMAPVNGKPFISYVIDELHKQGIERFIFSLGYQHEILTAYINEQYTSLEIEYSIEEEPLGTGGAIQLACKHARGKNVIATNGDTLFKVNLEELSSLHNDRKADCTLALKPMVDFDRYGVVELNNDLSIASFKEKKFYHEGLINGGLYALDAERLLQRKLPLKFSFEKDYLEVFYTEKKLFGLVQLGYFIDIGIPEYYIRAQNELVAGY